MSKYRWLFAMLLAVALSPVKLLAQEPAVITGRVTGASGNPENAVSVRVDALNVGTTTAADGTYRLVVPASRLGAGQQVRLTASRVGLSAQSRTVTLSPGAALTQNFSLGTDVLQLGEIVAVGQGTTTTRERVVSTVNSVRSEEITRSNESNVVAALSGKAPNVQITTSSGDPGAGSYIRIRGAASVEGGTQPLFVVDGTPIDNSTDQITVFGTTGTALQNRAADINPADIERVEILKGASATAIYGSRGANGVVIITTKSGRAGQTRATFSSSYSRDRVSQLPDLQTSYGQGSGGAASTTSSFSWGPLLAAGTPTYDHAGELFDTGNRLENNLTLSGGNERTTYYLSVGRLDQDGTILANSNYVRNSARLKGTHFLRDDLRVGGNIAYTQSDARYVQQGNNISGLFLGALRTPPNFNNCVPETCYLDPVTRLHRTYRNQNPTSLTQARGYDNPFFTINEMKNTANVGRAFGNVSLDYTPTDWLKVSYLLGADYVSDERLNLRPKSSSDTFNRLGDIIRANIVRRIWDSNLLATATRTWSDDLTGSITVGQNLNQTSEWWNQVNGNNVIAGTEETDFTLDLQGDEFKATTRTEGYFLTGETTIWDQLTLNATGRWDSSSTFGGDGQRFFYPGVGASWQFTRLGMFENVPFLDFGKIRASYGVSGTHPPVFSNVTGYATTSFTDGWVTTGLDPKYNGQEGVVSFFTRGNESIKPERKAEWEVGTDLAFFNRRASLGVTYYNRKTTDAILRVPVAPSTGFFSEYRNAAAFDNDGFEVTLDLTPVQARSFSWQINGQWAKNNSCVTNLAGAEEVVLDGFGTPNVSVLGPGVDGKDCHPYGVLYGDDFVRFGRGSVVDGVEIDEAFPNAAAGALYIAEDGFPLYDDVFHVTGDPNPDWTGSIRNTFTIGRNLTISGLLDIKHGGEMWNGTKGALSYFGTAGYTEPFHGAGKQMTISEFYGGAAVAGPGAAEVVTIDQSWFTSNLGSSFTGPISPFVEDAGYVKLRDVSVSYTFDQPFVKRMGFNSLNLTVSGRNLKTWTDYTGIDPESNLTAQNGAQGLDYFNNPQTRSYIFTVNLNR